MNSTRPRVATLSNGRRSLTVPVLAYSASDLRVPVLPARLARERLGEVTVARFGTASVRVTERPDGALALAVA